MNTVTYAEVQALVRRIPIIKLPIAYQLLTELAQEAVAQVSPQQQFLTLSPEEQQLLLKQQAADLLTHYQQTANDRNEWQSDDFIDD